MEPIDPEISELLTKLDDQSDIISRRLMDRFHEDDNAGSFETLYMCTHRNDLMIDVILKLLMDKGIVSQKEFLQASHAAGEEKLEYLLMIEDVPYGTYLEP